MTYNERYFILGVCVGTLLLSPLWTGGAAAETNTMDQWEEECQALTEEVQHSVQNSKVLGDAHDNIDQDKMKKLLLCQVVTTGNEQAAKENGQGGKENGQTTNGEAEYLKKPVWSFLLGDLKFRANAGYTETVGSEHLRPRVSLPDPGNSGNSAHKARLDHRKEAYGVEVGWFGKPVLRDVSFLFFQKEEKIKKHRKEVKKAEREVKGNLDSLVFDALKLDLSFGFGRSIVDNLAGQQTLETYNKTFFTVAVHYSIPLSQFLRLPFSNLPPPLPE